MAESVETVSLADLTPDPENARRHTPRNVGTIVDALHEVGAARSIVVDEHGVILAGNATVEAAAEAGITRVRVVDADGETLVAVRRTGLSPQQKRRLALFDNRAAELAEWEPEQLAAFLTEDADLLKGIFERDEIEDIIGDALRPDVGDDPGPQIDRAAELQSKWATERGQLWSIGRHRLLCGDATDAGDVARLLEEARPALTVTDPPYGVNYDPAWRNEAAAAGHLAYAPSRVGKVTGDDRRDWTDAWRLCPSDVVYCWHADRHASSTQQDLEEAGFEMRAQIIWAKPHFPISRGHYHWRHEPCWYVVRKDATASWTGDRQQTTVWDIPLDPNADGGHSAQKPLDCYAIPLKNHAGDLYDPFVGSGTAIVAAEQTGRACYALEIDPGYVAVCLERLSGMGLAPALVL